MAGLGEEIRRRRLARGLTMEQLGRQVGATQAYISRIEGNHVRPGIELADRLAHALEAEPALFRTLAEITPPDLTPLGALLVAERTARSWKQADLAQHLTINRPYLSALERGHERPSDALLQTIATVFDLPIDTVRRAAGRVDVPALLARIDEVPALRDLLDSMTHMPATQLEALVNAWRAITASTD